jgi:hypothetical protein
MNRKAIKLYWAHSKPNFGDCLSPLICELVSGRPITYAKINDCDLVAAGSLLQRLKERFWSRSTNIWGTGFIDKTSPHKSKHTYHAIRGRFSASVLSNKDISVFGDPGLLADQLINPNQIPKRFEIGIVPHYKDREHPTMARIKNDLKGIKIIDVFQPPKEVISQIAQCNSILSSSLHGLITADSLRIPNIRIEISTAIRGGDWKFNDYYSAFGIEPLKIQASTLASAEELRPHLQQYNRPRLDEIKDTLYKSFPDL